MWAVPMSRSEGINDGKWGQCCASGGGGRGEEKDESKKQTTQDPHRSY